MQYFLAKTDPQTYSIADLKRDKQTCWDGVHSYAALAALKQWCPGDFILIYHSQGEGKIVGLAEVVSSPVENKNDPRPSWVADIKFLKEFPETQIISLKEIKSTQLFSDFALVRQSRLSTMKCPPDFISWLRQKVSF